MVIKAQDLPAISDEVWAAIVSGQCRLLKLEEGQVSGGRYVVMIGDQLFLLGAQGDFVRPMSNAEVPPSVFGQVVVAEEQASQFGFVNSYR